MVEHSNIAGITNFRDYVGNLPHQWILDNLISGTADKSRRILSSAMVKEAVGAFVTKTSLAKRFRALPPPLQFKCAQIYLMGKNGLAADDPTLIAGDPLLASLLVFAAQNGGGIGGARFFGFDEFEPALRPLMADALAQAGAAGECAAQTPAFLCPWRPLNDVAALCSLAMHGLLKRSVHGGLSRSALNALKRLVHDSTMTGKSVTDGESGHPAGFLTGFCLSEGLIVDAGAEYLLNQQKFTAWLGKSMKERLNRLAACAEEFLGGFGLELTRELLTLAGGRWLAVNALVPEAERPALVRALNVLEFLGQVHTSHSHSSCGIRFVPQKSTDGSAAGKPGEDVDKLYAKEPRRDTVIMSDFSVVIPQEVSPAELFEFSKIGMLTAFDKVYKGQITKESVGNSMSGGADAETLRGWLRGRNVSANVSGTVDEWIREFSRLYVAAGSMLLTLDEKVTRQIAALEPLRRHLTEMNAHTVFKIRPGSEHKVLDMLEKLGFDTRAPGGRQAEAAKQEEKHAGAGNKTTVYEKHWQPLTDFSSVSDTPQPSKNRTKYGGGLRSLDISEMIHVADYAILTSQALVIDYTGSAHIKPGVHTVTPISVDRGIDAAVEAEIPCVRGRKQFYLDKIKRIGVVAQ
jgi:hypothetical protein